MSCFPWPVFFCIPAQISHGFSISLHRVYLNPNNHPFFRPGKQPLLPDPGIKTQWPVHIPFNIEMITPYIRAGILYIAKFRSSVRQMLFDDHLPVTGITHPFDLGSRLSKHINLYFCLFSVQSDYQLKLSKLKLILKVNNVNLPADYQTGKGKKYCTHRT